MAEVAITVDRADMEFLVRASRAAILWTRPAVTWAHLEQEGVGRGGQGPTQHPTDPVLVPLVASVSFQKSQALRRLTALEARVVHSMVVRLLLVGHRVQRIRAMEVAERYTVWQEPVARV